MATEYNLGMLLQHDTAYNVTYVAHDPQQPPKSLGKFFYPENAWDLVNFEKAVKNIKDENSFDVKLVNNFLKNKVNVQELKAPEKKLYWINQEKGISTLTFTQQ